MVNMPDVPQKALDEKADEFYPLITNDHPVWEEYFKKYPYLLERGDDREDPDRRLDVSYYLAKKWFTENPSPIGYMDEIVECGYGHSMTRRELFEHECPELKDSRERGRQFLEKLSEVPSDEVWDLESDVRRARRLGRGD